MQRTLLTAVMLGLLGSGPCFAASNQTQAAAPGQQASASAAGQQQSLVTAQKLTKDLQNLSLIDI